MHFLNALEIEGGKFDLEIEEYWIYSSKYIYRHVQNVPHSNQCSTDT